MWESRSPPIFYIKPVRFVSNGLFFVCFFLKRSYVLSLKKQDVLLTRFKRTKRSRLRVTQSKNQFLKLRRKNLLLRSFEQLASFNAFFIDFLNACSTTMSILPSGWRVAARLHHYVGHAERLEGSSASSPLCRSCRAVGGQLTALLFVVRRTSIFHFPFSIFNYGQRAAVGYNYSLLISSSIVHSAKSGYFQYSTFN